MINVPLKAQHFCPGFGKIIRLLNHPMIIFGEPPRSPLKDSRFALCLVRGSLIAVLCKPCPVVSISFFATYLSVLRQNFLSTFRVCLSPGFRPSLDNLAISEIPLPRKAFLVLLIARHGLPTTVGSTLRHRACRTWREDR